MNRNKFLLQRHLHWPFLGARARWRALALAALGTGFLSLAALLWQFSAQRLINAELTERLADLRQRQREQAAPSPPDAGGQAVRAAIADSLQRPWPELWALLESHAHRDIRLTRLRLGVEAPELLLEAQGQQLDALLEWANRLRADPRVLELHLHQQMVGEAAEGAERLPGLKLSLRLRGWPRRPQ